MEQRNRNTSTVHINTPQERLAKSSQAQPNGCLLWQGARSTNGYGTISVDGDTLLVLRYAWSVYNDRPIPHGDVICHTCDNKACIAKAHLVCSTQAWNMQDKLTKGRKGACKRGKGYTVAEHQEVFRRLDAGESGYAIAQTGLHSSGRAVSEQAISYIRRNRGKVVAFDARRLAKAEATHSRKAAKVVTILRTLDTLLTESIADLRKAA